MNASMNPNIKDSFTALLRANKLLADMPEPFPILTHIRVGYSVKLRCGAWMTVIKIKESSKHGVVFHLVRFDGVSGVEFEYGPTGDNLDSEYDDGKNAPFDIVRAEITSLRACKE